MGPGALLARLAVNLGGLAPFLPAHLNPRATATGAAVATAAAASGALGALGRSRPARVANAHLHIIAAIRCLSVLLPASVASRLQDELPSLLGIVSAAGADAKGEGGGGGGGGGGGRGAGEEGGCGGGGGGPAVWIERVVSAVARCLVGSPDFATELGKSLMEQRQMYEADEAARTTTNMLLGAVVASVDDERFVRSALQNIFVETDTSSQEERRGCAWAFGRSGAASPMHLAAAMEVLEQVLKDAAPARGRKATWFSSVSILRRDRDSATASDLALLAIATALVSLGIGK